MCWGRCETVTLFLTVYEVMARGLVGAAQTDEQEGR